LRRARIDALHVQRSTSLGQQLREGARATADVQPPQPSRRRKPIQEPLAIFGKAWRLPDVEKMSAPHCGFKVGYPTPQAAQRAQDEQDLQRALQSYRFFYPTVSVEGVFQGTRAAGVANNKGALILSGAPRHLLFTGNSDTPYMGATFKLKEIGPLVIELPAGPYLGIVNDHNFGWVHDIGLPGPDAGKGGKHLILPPNYKDDVPPGYFTVRSKTNYILVGARAASRRRHGRRAGSATSRQDVSTGAGRQSACVRVHRQDQR
jgi:hypothetical protein